MGVGVAAWHVYQKKAIAREEEEARKERDKLAQDYRERAEQRRQKEGIEAEQRSNVGYKMVHTKESLLLEDLLHLLLGNLHGASGRGSRRARRLGEG